MSPSHPFIGQTDTARPVPPRIEHNSSKRLQQYRLEKDNSLLGEGRFARVHHGTHGVTGQAVALKMTPRGALQNVKVTRAVRREIECLRLLNHPNIIKLFESIKDTNGIVLVLELGGKDLSHFLSPHHRISEHDTKKIFAQLLHTLEYCHSQGVVHRDIKPGNILIDTNLNIKLIDFGLSGFFATGVSLRADVGTYEYMAPELFLGTGYGPGVDVWSCGVLLYEMLVGEVPFGKEEREGFFEKRKKGEGLGDGGSIAAGAKDLVGKMLRFDPAERIGIEDVKRHEWLRLDLTVST